MVNSPNNQSPAGGPESERDAGPNSAPQSQPTAPRDQDRLSVQIARVAGIPVRLHFTFLLLIIWIGFGSMNGGLGWARLSLVFGVFLCVALHELGHALTGKHYGIQTSSITLYPIGGIARIADRPKPREELRIALAGPAVNVVIAAILSVIIIVHGSPVRALDMVHFNAAEWVMALLQINVWLVLFNMIPAFPMDGGRVLRAALALRGMPPAKATNLAAHIGQILALAAGIWAIFSGQWLLMFIAIFIYIGAGQEDLMVRQEAVIAGVPLSKVMVTNLETLSPGVSLREVAERLVHTSQQDFPVVMGEEVVGLMTRDRLLRSLSTEGPDAYVAGNMLREFSRAEPTRELSELIRDGAMLGRSLSQTLPVLVMETGGKLRGMVTAENVAEFYAIQQILGRSVDPQRVAR